MGADSRLRLAPLSTSAYKTISEVGPFIRDPLLALALATLAVSYSLQEVEQHSSGERNTSRPSIGPPHLHAPRLGMPRAPLERLSRQGRCLNLIYTKWLDVCPLHAEKIAQIQKMINATR